VNNQRFPTPGQHFDRGGDAILCRCEQRGCYGASAAREGFGFDSAFVGPDGDVAGAADKDEVGVGTCRLKALVEAYAASQLKDVQLFELRLGVGEKDCMRDPCIDETEVDKTIIELDREVNFHAVGLGHTDFGAFPKDLRFDKAGERSKRKPILVYYALKPSEPGRTTGPVAAHLRIAPVGVEELPPEINLVIIFYQNQAVSPHGHLSAAGKAGQLTPVLLWQLQCPIVNYYEIVAAAGHFCETDSMPGFGQFRLLCDAVSGEQ